MKIQIGAPKAFLSTVSVFALLVCLTVAGCKSKAEAPSSLPPLPGLPSAAAGQEQALQPHLDWFLGHVLEQDAAVALLGVRVNNEPGQSLPLPGWLNGLSAEQVTALYREQMRVRDELLNIERFSPEQHQAVNRIGSQLTLVSGHPRVLQQDGQALMLEAVSRQHGVLFEKALRQLGADPSARAVQVDSQTAGLNLAFKAESESDCLGKGLTSKSTCDWREEALLVCHRAHAGAALSCVATKFFVRQHADMLLQRVQALRELGAAARKQGVSQLTPLLGNRALTAKWLLAADLMEERLTILAKVPARCLQGGGSEPLMPKCSDDDPEFTKAMDSLRGFLEERGAYRRELSAWAEGGSTGR